MDIYRTPIFQHCFHMIFIIIVNYYSLISYFPNVTCVQSQDRILLFRQCFLSFLLHYYSTIPFEPTHEIMALFILRKPILQTRMRSHPVGLDVSLLVGSFVYFHSSCMRTVKTLARLGGCADSPEPSQVAYAIITIISWAGSFHIGKGHWNVTCK